MLQTSPSHPQPEGLSPFPHPLRDPRGLRGGRPRARGSPRSPRSPSAGEGGARCAPAELGGGEGGSGLLANGCSAPSSAPTPPPAPPPGFSSPLLSLRGSSAPPAAAGGGGDGGGGSGSPPPHKAERSGGCRNAWTEGPRSPPTPRIGSPPSPSSTSWILRNSPGATRRRRRRRRGGAGASRRKVWPELKWERELLAWGAPGTSSKRLVGKRAPSSSPRPRAGAGHGTSIPRARRGWGWRRGGFWGFLPPPRGVGDGKERAEPPWPRWFKPGPPQLRTPSEEGASRGAPNRPQLRAAQPPEPSAGQGGGSRAPTRSRTRFQPPPLVLASPRGLLSPSPAEDASAPIDRYPITGSRLSPARSLQVPTSNLLPPA